MARCCARVRTGIVFRIAESLLLIAGMVRPSTIEILALLWPSPARRFSVAKSFVVQLSPRVIGRAIKSPPPNLGHGHVHRIDRWGRFAWTCGRCGGGRR